MKFKIINREKNYKEWLDLDVCDDCGCCNSDTYFKLYTQHNEKEIVLCNSCVKRIFAEHSKDN